MGGKEMKFSEWINQQSDPFSRAGDGYDDLPESSKICIDDAVNRYVNNQLKHRKLLKRHSALLARDLNTNHWLSYARNLIKELLSAVDYIRNRSFKKRT